jgi:hypothetical protein
MTAWDILVGNSTVTGDSTAWKHLQNQNAGTGGGIGVPFPVNDVLASVYGDSVVTQTSSVELFAVCTTETVSSLVETNGVGAFTVNSGVFSASVDYDHTVASIETDSTKTNTEINNIEVGIV